MRRTWREPAWVADLIEMLQSHFTDQRKAAFLMSYTPPWSRG